MTGSLILDMLTDASEALGDARCEVAPHAQAHAGRAFVLIGAALAAARPAVDKRTGISLANMSKLCTIALDLEAVIAGADLLGGDLAEFCADLHERIDALIEDRPVRIGAPLISAASAVAGSA